MMRSDTISKELDILPGFHREKTFVERTNVCMNSCIGCLYMSCCLPCYLCWLYGKFPELSNNESNNQTNNNFINS